MWVEVFPGLRTQSVANGEDGGGWEAGVQCFLGFLLLRRARGLEQLLANGLEEEFFGARGSPSDGNGRVQSESALRPSRSAVVQELAQSLR